MTARRTVIALAALTGLMCAAIAGAWLFAATIQQQQDDRWCQYYAVVIGQNYQDPQVRVALIHAQRLQGCR